QFNTPARYRDRCEVEFVIRRVRNLRFRNRQRAFWRRAARGTVVPMGKKKMKRFLAFLIAANFIFFAVAASAQTKPPLRLLQTIPLPDLKGGDFDHFDVDLSGNRLFLTAEENNAVEVFDIRANTLIHTIRDVDTPHSLLYLPASKQLWVVDGGDGIIKVFDGNTYAVVGTVK